MNATPAIDRQVIAKMLEDFGADGLDIFEQVTDVFLSDTQVLVSELRLALIAGNYEQLARWAHRIKGGSAQLGVVTLARDAEAAETFALLGDEAALRLAVEKIEKDLPHLADALTALVRRVRLEGLGCLRASGREDP